MTQFLPPNLLALFAARDPIPYKPPTGQLSWEKDRERNPYTGIAEQVNLFEDPKDTPPPTRGETKQEKKIRRIKEKAIIRAKEIEEEVKNYDPHSNRNAGDAFKTLFVGRINFDTSESKLRREFDMYGPIRKISMVKDSNGKPRGYAFIEFEHERDMHTAYKNADGKKIDGRRVLVDVERGRTVKGWRPRRLGGGLGSTRRAPNDEISRQGGRSDMGRNERENDRRDVPGSDSRDRRKPSRDRDRRDRRDRDRDRDRKRDRDRERDRDRKDKDKEKDRDRDREESSKDKGRDRDRDRKHRNRDRSRERDRDSSRRKRSRERDRKDKDRSDRDKDRRSRSDKDKNKEDSGKKEPKSDYPEGPTKQEPSNGNMDQAPYDGDYGDGPSDIKQEASYKGYQESYEEKGQGDYPNSEMKGYPDGSANNMEY